MRMIFAHKYKHSHSDRRKRLRRLCKDGVIKCVCKNNEGFLYKVSEEIFNRFAKRTE